MADLTAKIFNTEAACFTVNTIANKVEEMKKRAAAQRTSAPYKKDWYGKRTYGHSKARFATQRFAARNVVLDEGKKSPLVTEGVSSLGE